MIEQTLDTNYILGLLVGWVSVLFSFGLVNLPELFSKRNKMFL